jgi:ADP-ribose pyrophosphatase
VDVTQTQGLEEEHEDIQLHLMSADDAISLLDQDIENASTIMGLQWLALNKQRLRDKWLG